MTDIQIFENEEFGMLRTLEINGKIYFCGKDIAVALGYKDTINALKNHCKTDGVVIRHLTDSLGRKQLAKFITEGNIYRLITHSQLPSAEQFETWVFDEVLPSIRKHGMYAVDELLESPDLLNQMIDELKEEKVKRKSSEDKQKQLETLVAVKDQQILEMNPKASYYDVVLNSPDLVSISIIAKDYGVSAISMNQLLHDKGIQFKKNDIWLLYQHYADCGYTGTKTYTYKDNHDVTHTKIHTYWTQKGRLFLYDLLKKDGILPLMERENNDDEE